MVSLAALPLVFFVARGGSLLCLDLNSVACLLDAISERNSQTIQGIILLFFDSAQAAFESSLRLTRLRLQNDLRQLLLRLLCRSWSATRPSAEIRMFVTLFSSSPTSLRHVGGVLLEVVANDLVVSLCSGLSENAR